LHAYDPEDLTADQRHWAEQANLHHARLQAILMEIAISERPTQRTLECTAELEALAHQLTYANLQLWTASAGPALRAAVCAKVVVGHLGRLCSQEAVADVAINATSVAAALTAMTDAQRRTMLSLPEVALAKDIADDCAHDFDNRVTWLQWRVKAGLERAKGPTRLRIIVNDNPVQPPSQDTQR
jgi:hypothetical protein